MKMTKKVFSAIAMAAMVAVTAIPAVPVEAAATPVAAYDFESGTGMSSSGIAGSSEPTVVQDSERGNVLKLSNGTSSQLIQKAQDSSMGEYDMRIDPGTPSSLKFANPFAGKSLSGATFSFWVKVPDDNAAQSAAGILGFVSGSKTIVHPDKASGDPNKQGLSDAHGPFMFGITCAYIDPMADSENPMVYFAGLHHNSYNLNDEEGILTSTSGNAGKWVYMTVTMNNSEGKIYVDGKQMETTDHKNKRWNDGEENGGSPGNVGQPKFLDFLSWSDTQAYIGYTGFSPTTELYLDDLTFYDKELSPADVSALYETAKTGSTTAGVSNGGSSASSSSANDAAREAKKKAAEEAAAAAAAAEAAAVEANKKLTDTIVASLQVKGMNGATPSVTPIYRGEATYTTVQTALNGVVLKDNYRLSDFVAMDINFGGTQPESVAKIVVDVPQGYDQNNLVVARINDDGTVSVLKHTIEDGKIIAKTNHFTKYAIVNLEPGKPGSASANLPKTGAAATGAVVAIGAVSALSGAVLLKKRKEEN